MISLFVSYVGTTSPEDPLWYGDITLVAEKFPSADDEIDILRQVIIDNARIRGIANYTKISIQHLIRLDNQGDKL